MKVPKVTSLWKETLKHEDMTIFFGNVGFFHTPHRALKNTPSTTHTKIDLALFPTECAIVPFFHEFNIYMK